MDGYGPKDAESCWSKALAFSFFLCVTKLLQVSQRSPAGGRRCFLTSGFFYPPLGADVFCKLPCGFLAQGLELVLGYMPRDAESPGNRRGRVWGLFVVNREGPSLKALT